MSQCGNSDPMWCFCGCCRPRDRGMWNKHHKLMAGSLASAPNRDKRQFSRTYLHPRPLFVFGLKCKTHLARPRFLLFIERYFLQYVTIIMRIKHKININNLGLSFISVGRPRRGPWPGVCFAHFTFPHLWVWHHPQHYVTLEQSSRIVTHQEWSDLNIWKLIIHILL